MIINSTPTVSFDNLFQLQDPTGAKDPCHYIANVQMYIIRHTQHGFNLLSPHFYGNVISKLWRLGGLDFEKVVIILIAAHYLSEGSGAADLGIDSKISQPFLSVSRV